MGDARRHPVRGSSPQVGRHTEHNGRLKVRILPTPLNQIIMKYPPYLKNHYSSPARTMTLPSCWSTETTRILSGSCSGFTSAMRPRLSPRRAVPKGEFCMSNWSVSKYSVPSSAKKKTWTTYRKKNKSSYNACSH